MRISVICKKAEWQIEQLQVAAVKLGVSVDVRDITDSESVPSNLGEVVLWRTSSLGSGPDRFKMMNAIEEKHLLINRCLAHIPQAVEKAFQQTYVREKTTFVRSIPTYTFHSLQEVETAIQNGVLRYPFIQKPNRGSKGHGVERIENKEMLRQFAKDIDKQVYQNYIYNSGDFRVLVLGGRMLGAIRRMAQEGKFLNNISQGGIAVAVTDKKTLAKLNQISTTIASIFGLTLCGVDIIFDDISQEYFFLEVNTVPQWRGFQETTGIDVAEELINYCKRMADRKHQQTPEVVLNEYQSQLNFLGEKKFHFLSRLHLWGGRSGAFNKELDKIRPAYIGLSEEDYRQKLKEIFMQIPQQSERMLSRKERGLYFKKYPKLFGLLGLLFKNLFAREVYGIDLRTYIRELVSDTELLDMKLSLEKDHAALRTLSTHAINYLYMLEDYLGTKESETNPREYLRIGASFPRQNVSLQIYFFTHCIIGASKFYSTDINKESLQTYTQMITLVEKVIQDNFEVVSLDNKFEFLVCAKICKYISVLELEILTEADHSLSPDGNFLIDTHNAWAAPDAINDFAGSEHRNVLYLMSQLPFHPTTEILP